MINGSKKLVNYNLLAIPGGFSAGDYLGSGKVFANKILYKLNNDV
ncbi:MAG: phosphoribosylformylglycinamidine synthase subunit PurQ, partial [Bacteroidetes bacterium]|nr:phosphoribosylformylglycinamidine synthase subunit PurQ [Bacteroidota bacterium]